MIDNLDLKLIDCLQQGLPLVSRPYQVIAHTLNLTENEVLQRITQLQQQGVIKRLGVIVNHRRLGYEANAMVVFDIPNHLIEQYAQKVSAFQFITLCYQRPRQGKQWSYNLYCMIHGKNKQTVLQQLSFLIESCDLQAIEKQVLFSKQCFKQRGAIYSHG